MPSNVIQDDAQSRQINLQRPLLFFKQNSDVDAAALDQDGAARLRINVRDCIHEFLVKTRERGAVTSKPLNAPSSSSHHRVPPSCRRGEDHYIPHIAKTSEASA
jgi:hypothetical protein